MKLIREKKQKDFRIIKKTLALSIAILLCYHYINNIQLIASSSTTSTTNDGQEQTSLFSTSKSSFFRIFPTKQFLRKPHRQYSNAFDQSFGFFTDISNHDWELYKLRYDRHLDGDIKTNRIYLDKTINKKHKPKKGYTKQIQSSTAYLFYQNNYDAEFTCPHEIQLGVQASARIGETPKWICDPHRVISMARWRRQEKNNCNGCLAYVFAEDDSRKFIKDLNEALEKECEIHVFSKVIHNLIYMSNMPLGKNIHVHSWGIEGQNDVRKGRRDYLTFQETLKELNHNGCAIDILSVDCGGCEWNIYLDMLNSDVTVTQIMMKLHSAPYLVNDLFLEMKRHGYVIFHKESNVIDDGHDGHNQEFSFLRLAPGFFGQ